jgi:hypothetical protein
LLLQYLFSIILSQFFIITSLQRLQGFLRLYPRNLIALIKLFSFNFRSYSQAWCSVPLMFFNQAPINLMFPIVIETILIWRVMPMPQIQNPFVWVWLTKKINTLSDIIFGETKVILGERPFYWIRTCLISLSLS